MYVTTGSVPSTIDRMKRIKKLDTSCAEYSFFWDIKFEILLADSCCACMCSHITFTSRALPGLRNRPSQSVAFSLKYRRHASTTMGTPFAAFGWHSSDAVKLIEVPRVALTRVVRLSDACLSSGDVVLTMNVFVRGTVAV